MPLQLSRVCVALAVIFLTPEVVCGLDAKRSPRFQPMLPPLGQKDQGNASPWPYVPLGEHSSLFKRDFSRQTPVLAPVPDETPPCGATGCLTYCCAAGQKCCLNGCMPDDGSLCHQTGYCAAGWDSCGATACYPVGVGATCCSTLGTYCEAGYQCVGSIIKGYSCDAIGGGTVSTSSTAPLPTASSSTTPTTPDATPGETTPLPPATTTGKTTVLQPSTTTDTVSFPPSATVESTVLASGATYGSSIVQNPTTVDTTVVVPASTSAVKPSTSTSSNTSLSGGQRTVVWSIEVHGWASIGMAFVSYLAARV